MKKIIAFRRMAFKTDSQTKLASSIDPCQLEALSIAQNLIRLIDKEDERFVRALNNV